MNTVAVCCLSQLRTLWHSTTPPPACFTPCAAVHPRTSLLSTPLHDLCQQLPDVYDVRSDPFDGAGVNVSTREVRGTGLAAVGEMGPPCGEVGLREV